MVLHRKRACHVVLPYPSNWTNMQNSGLKNKNMLIKHAWMVTQRLRIGAQFSHVLRPNHVIISTYSMVWSRLRKQDSRKIHYGPIFTKLYNQKSHKLYSKEKHSKQLSYILVYSFHILFDLHDFYPHLVIGQLFWVKFLHWTLEIVNLPKARIWFINMKVKAILNFWLQKFQNCVKMC